MTKFFVFLMPLLYVILYEIRNRLNLGIHSVYGIVYLCLFTIYIFFENPVINVIKYSIILRMKGIEIENIKYKSTF